MCTNNTCNPEVDCPNEDECTSGSNCTSGSGGTCDGSGCGTAAESISVVPSQVSIPVGQWAYLSVEAEPAGSDPDVEWYSDDESVAAVGPSGNVYAVSPGIANIFATTKDGLEDYCFVQVVEAGSVPVTCVELDCSALTLQKGDHCTLNATVCPENATNPSVEWHSSDEDVAHVDGGLVCAIGVGEAVITAMSADNSYIQDTCTVTVTDSSSPDTPYAPVESVAVYPASFSLRVGEWYYALVAVVSPSDAKQKVTWHSSNPSVASVHPETGNVFAGSAGTAVITAVSCADSSKYDTCTVTVTGSNTPYAPVESVAVCPETVAMKVGEWYHELDAIVCPSDAKQKVTWHSSNPAAVSVVPDTGWLHANGVGTAVITAVSYTDSSKRDTCTVTVTPAHVDPPTTTYGPEITLEGDADVVMYRWSETGGHSDSDYTVGAHAPYYHGCGMEKNTVSRVYLELNLPALPNNPRIKKAELTFFQEGFGGDEVEGLTGKLGLYPVNGCFPEDNFEPSEELLDYATLVSTADAAYTFDVTRLMEQALEGNLHADLVLKLMHEPIVSVEDNYINYVTLYGTEDCPSHRPKLKITYESGYEVNSSYRAHTHEVGRFGQASIDLQRGNLTFESEDFNWGGSRMPVAIRHQYNSALSGAQYTNTPEIGLFAADNSAMKLGNGWRLNVMQSMVPVNFSYDGNDYSGYVYTDENGAYTYFRPAENSSTSYCDVDGSGMVYNNVAGTLNDGSQTLTFEDGRLVEIWDEYGNTMTLTYDGNRLIAVNDGARRKDADQEEEGRKFEITYNAWGYLTAVVAPDGTRVTYTYSGDLLTSITYPGDRIAVITYDGTDKPSSVILKNTSGRELYKVEYTFTDGRVANVTEYGKKDGAWVQGNCTDYTYSVVGRHTIAVTEEESDEPDESDTVLTTVYGFDTDGGIVSEYAYTREDGGAGVVVGDGPSGIHPYSGDGGMRVVSNVDNLLKNHSFETLSNWSSTSNLLLELYNGESAARYGRKVLHLTSQSESSQGVYQTVALPAGTYTFSAYIHTVSEIGSNDSDGVYLWACGASGNELGVSEHIRYSGNQFIRPEVTFVLNEAQEVTLYIMLHGAGTVGVDAAQLERNPSANAYNLLENNNFEHGAEKWSRTTGATVTTQTCFNMTSALQITGNPGISRNASQDVAVKTAKTTRETFTLSGWAKTTGALPEHERNGLAPSFRLRARICYVDGTTEDHCADFTPGTTAWQFASVQFAKEQYAEVDMVKVFCEYDRNVGTAWFDNIQLTRDSLEQNLTADDFPTETDGTDGENTTPEEPTPEDTTDTSFEEARDDYGNILTETTFYEGADGTIYRSFEYDDTTGNNLVKETDPRGFVTTYATDPDTSRVTQMTDRCGNSTGYEYDASGRTTKVINPAEGTGSTVSYAYDTFDNLTAITRGDGMQYALGYNPFHKLQSIGVAGVSNPLVTYGYKNKNGRLKSVTYANGDKMEATYNRLGQLITETWFNAANEETHKYRYTYDGQGTLIETVDTKTSARYNYMYEDGRLLRVSQWDNNLLVATVLYVYNDDGSVKEKRIRTVFGEDWVYSYSTGENDASVVQFQVPMAGASNGQTTVTSQSRTDAFGRKVSDLLQFGTGSVSREFSYHVGAVTPVHRGNDKVKGDPTTHLVSCIALSGGRTLCYKYDGEERIVEVDDSELGVTFYDYDAQGQLIKETFRDKTTGNETVVSQMTYDGYGNILSKNGVDYGYGPGAWKDKLTSYGDSDISDITYDAQGNPLTYRGRTLTWEKGRQLKQVTNPSDTEGPTYNYTYTYNASGIRTSKTVDGVTHTYILDGAKILQETWGNHTLVPLYDAEESVCGIVYNGETYFFQKNLQGDVIGIVNSANETVVKYSYDAWGKCNMYESSNTVGTINPFRYRGYYYDTETGWYYLQSRYYDPVVGRFVNGDGAEIIHRFKGAAKSLNLYAYCCCDPVNTTDETGQWKLPKLVACGIQVEADVGLFTLGIEIIFANGKAYCFGYNGLSSAFSIRDVVTLITKTVVNPFRPRNIKKVFSQFFTGSVSFCVFAVFSALSTPFNPNDYTNHFVGFSTTIPTVYGVALKSYVSTWTFLTSVGVGFSYPVAFDFGASYTYYVYHGTLSDIAASVRNFASKETKGLRP